MRKSPVYVLDQGSQAAWPALIQRNLRNILALFACVAAGLAPAVYGAGAIAQATFNDNTAGVLAGQKGGTGFATAPTWTNAYGSGITVVAGDLAAPTYVNTGYALTQSGTPQHVYNSGSSSSASRLIANGGLTATTTWFSLLARVDSGGRAGIEIDDPQNSAYNRVILRQATTPTTPTMVQLYIDPSGNLDLPGTGTLVGSNILIVGRLTLNTSGTKDTLDVWVNPDVTSASVYNAAVGSGQLVMNSIDWDTASQGATAPGIQYVSLVAYTGGHVDNLVFSDSSTSYADVTGFQPPVPLVNISATQNATEPSTPGSFTITRSGVTDNSITVGYTYSGTAVQGTDYTESGGGSVTFAPGATNATVTITPLETSTPEPPRTVIMTLQSDPSYTLGNASGTVMVNDANDANALVWYMFTAGLAPDYVFDTNVVANPLTGIGTISTAYDVSPPNSWAMSGNVTPNTEALAVANNSYLSMIVSPTAGHALTLTNLEFQAIYGNYLDQDLSTTGAVVFVRSSLDNFTADLGSFIQLPDTAPTFAWWQTNEINLDDTFANLSSAVEFRLYVYDDTSISAVAVRLDNLFLRGYSSTAVSKNQISIIADQPNASEPSTNGDFNIIRYGSTASSLNVFYSIGGTASNGVDYVTLSGSATIPAGATNVNVPVQVISKPNIDPTRTVILSLQTNAAYSLVAPTNATVSIADNKTGFTVAATDNSAYKRLASLTGTFTIFRSGSLNDPETVNFALGGTAVLGSDYVPSVTNSVAFASGVSSVAVQIAPVESGVLTGNRNVTLTLQPGASYLLVGSNMDTVTIVDDQLPPATVLWADNFDAGTSATNYTTTSTTADYLADPAFDYSTIGLVPAPGDTNTIGLKLMADLSSGHRAAVNLYPVGQSFSGNFALRFSACLCFDYAGNYDQSLLVFGLNQTGTAVNYVTDASGWPAYGQGVVATIATRIGRPDIFDLYCETNTAGNLGRMAYAEEQNALFNNPPYTELGRPDNFFLSSTMTWVDVELSQVGNVITLKANNTVVLQCTNSTAATNGNIFIGYAHASDDQPTLNSYAVVDNLRVVSVAGPAQPVITSVQVAGGNVTVQFTGDASDVPGAFSLQSSATVASGFAAEGSAVITGSAGHFQAVTAVNGAMRFYRIVR